MEEVLEVNTIRALRQRYRPLAIKRKRIEEPFVWMKTVGGLPNTRLCGRDLVEWFFVLTAAATISFLAFPRP